MTQLLPEQSTDSDINEEKPKNQMYQHFHQAKEAIQGVEAIDYFFAKEMINALVIHDTVNQICIANLNHLFLALSASLRAGHSCLPLNEVADQHWGNSYSRRYEQSCSDTLEEEKNLSHRGFIFAPLAQLHTMLIKLNISEDDNQLLVYKNHNIYLRRYFQFETDLEQAINARLSQQCQFDNNAVANCIAELFPKDSEKQPPELDWQKIAVANAINKSFSVIAGGPGTGKTYTVTKLLAALVLLHQHNVGSTNDELRIALVAPTGKAAQRLSESIVDAVTGFSELIAAEVLAAIPTQAQTIHRLLGVLPNSPNFRHQEDNLLPYDIILIDEVSMVDLPLMTRVFRALKPDAKVILLGDADQLPSVAAGSVLADIAPRPHGGFSAENNEYLCEVCQLDFEQLTTAFIHDKTHEKLPVDYLTFLVKSRRFDGQGGIGLLANSVIRGDSVTSWQLLCQSQPAVNNTQGNGQLSLAQGDYSQWLAPLVKQYYQPISTCKEVKQAFVLLSKFRVLCATRQGEQGVEQMNELIKTYLGKNNSPYQQSQQSLYHGQPIMINENDYRLGLYNGDIGIIWSVIDKDGNKHLMACFEAVNTTDKDNELNQQGIRQILPSRLPTYESVYAMTIHKTQGSEFGHVAMVISATHSEQRDTGSKLLSRELLYTGITRAKKQLTIAANQQVWRQGVTAQVQRHSGLRLYDAPEK
jgi:exodeoxyribonuclease V alpha subunit